MSQAYQSSSNNLIISYTKLNKNNNLYLLSNPLFILIFILIIPEALSVNPVLNLRDDFPYLLNTTNGQVIEPRDYMNFDNIYAPNETYKRQQTAQGRNYYLMKAFDYANYYQSDYWHYSNEADLRISAHPVANADKCAQQLDWLERKLNLSGVLFHKGQEHINFASLIDAFGRPQAGTNLGQSHWLGSYYECKKVGINIQRFQLEEEDEEREDVECRGAEVGKNDRCRGNFTGTSVGGSGGGGGGRDAVEVAQQDKQLLKARYCIGKARDLDWPSEQEDNYVPRISYKVGLCLPETCETLSFRKHKTQIERLLRFNVPEHLKTRITLNDIYCLPDERSPIRAFSLPAQIFIGICSTWLLLSLLATWLYSNYHPQHKQQNQTANRKSRESLYKQQPAVGNSNEIFEAATRCHQVDLEVTVYEPVEEVASGEIVSKMATTNGLQFGLVTKNSKQVPLITSPILGKDEDAYGNSLIKHKTKANEDDQDDVDDEHHPNETGQFRATLQTTTTTTTTLTTTLYSWLESLHPNLISMLEALSIEVNMREFQEAPLLLRNRNTKLRINLNALDFIKCLCCLLVIFGHIIFIHMQHLSNILNVIEISNGLPPRFLIAFFNFVDTFFIISGMLTTYFIFKRFNKQTFASPLIWFSITLLRLVRLTPVYLLTFWFVKTITVYLSEGPIWDYGTDRKSIKGLCINDQWWKSILYLGNLNTIQPLCILPAWSIILDAQYSIILPPIIYLIFRHKRLGYISLIIGIIISTTNMSIQLATQTAVKTADMAKVRLHVYPMISRFATEFYNTPWNRLGPVAIGVMGGHMLYLYDIGSIRQWPWFMRGAAFKVNLIMHLFVLLLPTIGLYTDPPESTHDTDITIFVISNATIKPIWSLINTISLLRLITDLGDRSDLVKFISHNIWHCLGKLCFAAYLIHYEIILIMLKSRREGLVDPTWWSCAREFCCALLLTIIVSYLVYILFEAPINKLFMISLVKPNYHHHQNQAKNKKNIREGGEFGEAIAPDGDDDTNTGIQQLNGTIQTIKSNN